MLKNGIAALLIAVPALVGLTVSGGAAAAPDLPEPPAPGAMPSAPRPPTPGVKLPSPPSPGDLPDPAGIFDDDDVGPPHKSLPKPKKLHKKGKKK